MVQEILSELIYIYTTFAIAAPLLVGIISPLISSVISRIEEKRFEHFQVLKNKTKELEKAEDPTEYERIKEEKEEAEQEYASTKEKAGWLSHSVILGGIVTLLSIVGILNLFGVITAGGSFASTNLYLSATLALFFIEVILLLWLVAYYVRSERKEAIKKLTSTSK